jgi:L-threonylcarbamoyladenylate synthase
VSRIVPAEPAAIAAAAEELRAGRLVAFPTETVYGLGALARDPAAVAEVFRAKGRPADHPLIVHLASAEQLGAWADPVPEAARRLAARFWPGPLSLVLRRAAGVADVVTGGQATVALRAPAHPVARALLRALGEAIAAPSANRFGRISPTTAGHVAAEFAERELTILDGGPCRVGLESTILDLSGPRPRLLRPGAVSADELAAALGREVALADAGPEDTAPEDAAARPEPQAPRAPGRLASHYAPRAPLRWVAAGDLDREVAATPRAALLLRAAARPDGHRGPWRRLPRDAAGYGRGLYAALRELDAGGPPELLVERPPSGPPWTAVRDRLRRAAGPRHDAPDAEPTPEEER